jgi:hypothetical protein
MEVRSDVTVLSDGRKAATGATGSGKRRRDDDFGGIDGVEEEREEGTPPQSS